MQKLIIRFSYQCIIGFFVFSNLSSLSAQNVLTKSEAVNITLDNNYNIKLAENDLLVAKNNTSKELNGYNPTVNANAGANGSLGGSSQVFSTGNENKVTNAFNWAGNAAFTANYAIVDKTRDAILEQLKEVVDLTDLQLRLTIENNLLQVFGGYYEVARLSQNLNVLEQTLEVSKQRLLRTRYQYESGQGIKLDMLNAEVDIQRDSINLLNIKNQISTAKRNLNVVMGREVTTEFSVDTIVTYNESLSLIQVMEEAKQNNITVQVINKNIDISEMDIDIFDSGKKPVLGVNAGYNFNFSDNAIGSFIDFSFSHALSAGLTMSWNLFDGGRRRMQQANARINIENQHIQKEQIFQELERDVNNAWENYQNALFVLQAEERNTEINKLNFTRTEEQFKIGQVTSIEFRQAQLNLLNATTNKNAAKFDAKVMELQLAQLAGNILDY